MEKYELTENFIEVDGRKLYQIRALIDIAQFNVHAGDLGGCVESEDNLSQDGNAWISGNACVYDNARISGNAWVYGNARIFENACVCDNAKAFDYAWISDCAKVSDCACVCGNAWIYDNAFVCNNAWVCGDTRVCGNAKVSCDTDYATIKGFGTEYVDMTFFKCEDGLVRVSYDCFYGTIKEFRKQVRKIREGKVAKEYLMIADLMEYHFEESKNEEIN